MPKNWLSPRRWFDFKGRAGRREFFLYLLIGFVIYFGPALTIMSFDRGGGPAGPPDEMNIPLVILFSAWSLVSLLVLAAMLAVAFRRVHDHDKSAWYLLLGFIPLIGWVFVLIWIFSNGDEGENHYGPDPRQPVAAGYAGIFD